jgi:hypothetical protein
VLDTDVEGDLAVLRACHVDDSVVKAVTTNSIVNDATVSKLTEATLVLRNGTWVLARHTTISEWPDGEGCRE